MMAFLRRLFDLLSAWLVVILCIAFIGYIAWPLLSDKFFSLCSNPDWAFCRGEWSQEDKADQVQQTIEGKTKSFFDIARTAVSDILTDRGGKKSVRYELSKEANVYMPVPEATN